MARRDLDAAREHVLLPSTLREDARDLLPGDARFVGVTELGEGWVVYGAATTAMRGMPGPAIACLELFRGRDGKLRLEVSGSSATGAKSMSPADLATAFEQSLSFRERERPKRASRTWSPPPAHPAPITAIRWLGRADAGVAPSDVDAAERALGVTLPRGYREYVTRFGAALECDLVRIYPPRRIADELAEWRVRVDAYWLWTTDELDRDRAQRCIVLGDTTQGDEIVLDPQRPDALFVLPRHHHVVARIPGDLTHTLAWLCESGELAAPSPVRYAEPLEGQVHRMYDPTNNEGDEDDWLADARVTHDVLLALDPGAQSVFHDDDDGGWTVLLPRIGGTAFVHADGGVSVSCDPEADLTRLDALLRDRGLELRAR
ncbi:SMI1/KNR4 family protein [Sandaracinus amylolyticus]|uniref:SMI1/KNR4 family protein n=1 Tax=Sandaracinus amylolyticus TaxID=927083 RepID=UPI001F2E7942|nr:SMI1/KNR4 family protein [Sandaracinus amylolyticus]